MKKVFTSSWLAKAILWAGYHTITIGPFVFSERAELDQSVRNHECTHARQWIEVTVLAGFTLWLLMIIANLSAWWMLLAPTCFYCWYGIEWAIRLCSLHDSNQAYKAVSFEQEAKLAEKDDNYLENSHYFAWMRLLNKK